MERPTLAAASVDAVVSCCISPPFGGLSTTQGQIAYVLLTRAPLYRGRSPFSHDLHVLGAPLTFVLSQDQTLQFESLRRLIFWLTPQLVAITHRRLWHEGIVLYLFLGPA